MKIRLLAVSVAGICFAALATPAAAQTSEWTASIRLPGGSIYDVTAASPAYLWGAGAGGIFRSKDAGQTWSVAYTTGAWLGAIDAAPGGRQGWAVGALGAIAATTDGGTTWHEQSAHTNINLSDVAALDDMHAIAVGKGVGISDVVVEPQPSIILTTQDGGATWSEVRLSGDYEPLMLDFLPDGKHGWMTATQCVPSQGATSGPNSCGAIKQALLVTTDGGASWTPMQTDAAPYRLRFVNETTGWAFGSTCAAGPACESGILRTTDGGATWKLVTDANAAFDVIDANSVIAGSLRCENGCQTTIVRTDDSGATWHALGTVDSSFAETAFGDADRGALVGSGPSRPLYTADGGRTWQTSQFPVVAGSGAVSFPDAVHGWFAASSLLRTLDGGATWAPVSDRTFQDVVFVSAAEGWATASTCSGPCHFEVLHSLDGGSSWDRQYQADVPNPGKLSFVSPAEGWVVFDSEGRTLHTADGGASWQADTLPTPAGGRNMWGAAVVPGAAWTAVAACADAFTSCQGHVYRTVDGGATWPSAGDLAGEVCSLGPIAALDVNRTWVVTQSCANPVVSTLHRTSDGGAQWTSTVVVLPPGLSNMHFFDAKTGRALAQICDAVGCASAIARSSNGGVTWSVGTQVDAAYFGAAAFVAPEDIWASATTGGGITAVAAQSLYHFTGPALPTTSRVTLPDTGAAGGTGGRTSVVGLAAFALLALASLALAAAAYARRR